MAATLTFAYPACAERNLTAVLEGEVAYLDPHFTTATVSRTFGYLVYDTLFSMDSAGAIRPQMVRDTEISPDGLLYTFRLRDGLAWHDGTPVTASDCVASLRRWAPRDPLGRMLLAAAEGFEVRDAHSFTLKLKRPFPLVLDVLGKPNAIVPFMMPERLARTEVAAKPAEVVGSGPFVFRADLWRSGDVMVLDRNPAYVPRAEPADFLAGGKAVKIDRLTLKVEPDPATAASALGNGEVDYLQYVPFDLIDKLKHTRGIEVMALGGRDMFQGEFRINSAAKPLDDPAVRQVLWKLVDQTELLQAIGIPPEFRQTCASFWVCGTPLASDAGTQAARFSIEAARDALKRTNYHGEKIVVLEIGNDPNDMAATTVLVNNLKQAGFAVDEQVSDWATVLAKRAKRDTWNLYPVYANGVDMQSPLTHFFIASNCSDYAGWTCDPRVTELLKQFVEVKTPEERKAIAARIQADEYETVPSVLWGQFTVPVAYRSVLTGLVPSSFPIFWNVDKTDP